MRGRRLNRLIQIIALLKGPTAYNARNLAEFFGISRRNVYRDIAVLELAGVPTYYDGEFGQRGGYRIRSDWWFPAIGLTDGECLDLAVLTRAAESQSIPLLDDVCSVRDKLLGTLPAKQQDLIRTASELFDVLGLRIADHGHCQKVMVTLQTAVLKRQQIEGRYRSPHQKKSVKVSLQCQRIFLAGQAWYLAAHDNADQKTKLYRVARFQEVRLTTKAVTAPPCGSLREILGNAWSIYRGDRDWHIEILFTPDAAELVAETKWHHTQEVESKRDGSLVFRATVAGLSEIKWWILGWGDRAKVLKPTELAEEVRRLCHTTAAQYGANSSKQKAGTR